MASLGATSLVRHVEGDADGVRDQRAISLPLVRTVEVGEFRAL